MKLFLKKNFSRNRDRFLRSHFEASFEEKAFLKVFFFELSLPRKIRRHSFLKLTKHSRNSSLSRLKNRCVFSSRSRGVKRDFRISRIAFKESFSRGWVQGFYK